MRVSRLVTVFALGLFVQAAFAQTPMTAEQPPFIQSALSISGLRHHSTSGVCPSSKPRKKSSCCLPPGVSRRHPSVMRSAGTQQVVAQERGFLTIWGEDKNEKTQLASGLKWEPTCTARAVELATLE